jgi:hypothetical protein
MTNDQHDEQPLTDKTPIPTEPAIINIKPQEELGGLLQRIKAEPSSAILLVVPEKAIVAQGPIAFKLLADVAGKLQKELSIVSDTPQIQSLARRAGLKVEGVEAGDTEGHGFVAGADIAETGMVMAQPAVDEPPRKRVSANEEFEHEDESSSPFTAAAGGVGSVFAGSKSAWGEWLRSHKVMLGVVGAFLLIAVGGMAMAAYYLPKATVTLYTEKRTIDRDLQVTADPEAAAVNKKELIIPATVLEAEVEQVGTYESTGEEEVGEKATGTITIVNKSSDDKELKAGTVVTSGGKQFILNAKVEVPAAERDFFVTTNGRANAAVTAAAIGPEYNLKANSDFTVGGYEASTLTARNEKEFTGGSKEMVAVVTAEDQQTALKELSQQAQDKVESDLRKTLSKGQLLLDDAITIETASTVFSHEVGDEVDSFTLTIVATATAPVVAESDLSSLLTGAVEAKVPDGYKLDGSQPEIENRVMEVGDDGVLQLSSTFKARVVPVVDEASLIDEIKGQHPTAVESFLKSQPNLNGYDISLSPRLPGPFYRLPRLESNIEVMVEVAE